MADPQIIQCAAACTVTVVHSLPLLEMTVDEGTQIAGAVLAVWAAGWAFRALIQALRSDGNSSTQED
ncbi:MAG: hypothetical protein J0H59_01675 [Comamonadaceae bacterium]|nr:hypothetical protein [Comamonadaceae bacterium]